MAGTEKVYSGHDRYLTHRGREYVFLRSHPTVNRAHAHARDLRSETDRATLVEDDPEHGPAVYICAERQGDDPPSLSPQT